MRANSDAVKQGVWDRRAERGGVETQLRVNGMRVWQGGNRE